MGRTAGYLWLLAALVTLGGLAVPGPDDVRLAWAIGLGVYGVVYAAGCLTGAIPWARAPMWQHRAAIVLAVGPMTALVVWATGEAESYMLFVMPAAIFFTAFFYSPRFTFALVVLHVVALATPLLYDGDAVELGYPARLFALAAVAAVLAWLVLWLKRGLVEAELRQREMALRDPLTGVGNRRALDEALREEVAGAAAAAAGNREPVPSALLVLDLDRFKAINDTRGHPAGDRVLERVAAACAEVVRPGDTLARIGGDEFAVVAPRAGEVGARRMVAALTEAVAAVDAGDGERLTATVSHALFGADGTSAADLMRAADRRLHARKRKRTAS
jgi:diguanylate cyclase (GGDEF)-like protein